MRRPLTLCKKKRDQSPGVLGRSANSPLGNRAGGQPGLAAGLRAAPAGEEPIPEYTFKPKKEGEVNLVDPNGNVERVEN